MRRQRPATDRARSGGAHQLGQRYRGCSLDLNGALPTLTGSLKLTAEPGVATLVGQDAAFAGLTIDGGTLDLTDFHFAHTAGLVARDASVTLTDSAVTDSVGAGIHAVDTALTGTGAEFSDNAGGGIVVKSADADSKVSLADSTVSRNISPGDGGGIHVDGAALDLDGVTIESNYAAGDHGGGIYATGSGTHLLRSVTASGSSAHKRGGGIFVDGASAVVMVNPTVQHNALRILEGEAEGSGVYSTAGVLLIVSGTISDNTPKGSQCHSEGTAAVGLAPSRALCEGIPKARW